MLLRIKRSTPWLVFLYTMIAMQIASCLASFFLLMLHCVPLSAVWDPETPGAKCAKLEAAYASIYVSSGIGIATDIIFALLPISFIRKMQRPLREKLVLSALMALGLFAAAASVVKTTLVKHYGSTGDALWDSVDLNIWSTLEVQTGIIAACIPCLKSPFERVLDRLGLISKKGLSGYSGREGYLQYDDGRTHKLSGITRSSNPENRSNSMGAHSEENILSPVELEGNSTPRHVANGRIVKTAELRFVEGAEGAGEGR